MSANDNSMFAGQNGSVTIRANRLASAAKILAVEALVMPVAAVSALHGDIILKAIGWLFLLFFGTGGVFALVMIARRDWSLILTNAGIEMNGTDAYSRRALLRWEDIEEIKVIQIQSVKMVGIRLSSYDNYLKSLDAEKTRFTQKIAMRLTALISFSKKFNACSASNEELLKKLDAWNGAKDIRSLLEGNRKACGYDISVGRLDRSPEKLADFLCASREAFIAKRCGFNPFSTLDPAT